MSTVQTFCYPVLRSWHEDCPIHPISPSPSPYLTSSFYRPVPIFHSFTQWTPLHCTQSCLCRPFKPASQLSSTKPRWLCALDRGKKMLSCCESQRHYQPFSSLVAVISPTDKICWVFTMFDLRKYSYTSHSKLLGDSHRRCQPPTLWIATCVYL